jgi:hypothetical protein
LWDEGEMGTTTDVKKVSVGEVFTEVGTTAVYEYDFGDGWMHHLELVEISTHPIDEVLPQIIGGENACPPEDCGGTYGCKELKEILMNPKHPEYKSFKIWVGSKFDPMVCELKTIQQKLGKLRKSIDEYEEGF